MKIEKVNENQIRCTLSREDLEDRQIKLSELAYGSEKAKNLFRDMIQQANYEFGFEVNDIPLMVEAIPLSGDNIILQITKVEYPDELDTRFSKFTESEEEESESYDGNLFPKIQGADDILGMFKKLRKEAEEKQDQEIHSNVEKEDELTEPNVEPEKEVVREEVQIPKDLVKMFAFSGLENLERLSHVLDGFYDGENCVYKDMQKNRFYLLLHKSQHTPEEFNKVCNIASEYGMQTKYVSAAEAYLKEHGKLILKENAIQILNSL